jgi:hypothetical protein
MKLDAEFRALMPKLTKDEYAKLEQSILEEGCRDPLVFWNGLLVDGYNRYEICDKYGIGFLHTTIELDSREEAINWIIDNQLGRRNLTVEQKTYLIGKKYKKEKQAHGGDRKSSSENELEGKVSERIAAEHKVSVGKVVNSGKFVDAVDTITQNVDEDARDEILSRELDATQDDVKTLATQSKDIQRKAVEKARSGTKLRQAIREAVGNRENRKGSCTKSDRI